MRAWPRSPSPRTSAPRRRLRCAALPGQYCISRYDRDQDDRNGNGRGDACEDADGDGLVKACDNCPIAPHSDQRDGDDDGVGDVCEDEVPVAHDPIYACAIDASFHRFEGSVTVGSLLFSLPWLLARRRHRRCPSRLR